MGDIIPSLIKKSNHNSLIKFSMDSNQYVSLSFIAKFTNLQEIILSFSYAKCFKDFRNLQYITFSQLQILKITDSFPEFELLINFLETNGRTLKELYLSEFIGICDNPLNLAIAMFCPNLRKLSTGFKSNESETMKIVFCNCQYLESIKISCGGEFLSEKEALEMVVNNSPKDFYELIFYHQYPVQPELLPEELESFFVIWSNRVPRKSLSLIIGTHGRTGSLGGNNENIKIIEKYIDLGIIKKFNLAIHE